MQIAPYGLVFELESLPLAHYYFCSSYSDSKQKISYRDIRQIIAIHDIIEISYRPKLTIAVTEKLILSLSTSYVTVNNGPD